MARTVWQDRVGTDPAIHHGEPCILGTRVPVRILVGSLADGMTPDEILAEYPQVTHRDLLGALAYAAEALHHARSRVLEDDPKVVRVLAEITAKAHVRVRDLQERCGLTRAETVAALTRLKDAGLIDRRAAPIEDFSLYFITAAGLSAERGSRRSACRL